MIQIDSDMDFKVVWKIFWKNESTSGFGESEFFFYILVLFRY